MKQFESAFICKTQVLLFARRVVVTACLLLGDRQLEFVCGRNISVAGSVSGTRAEERVGGWMVTSAGERDGVEKADFGWRSRAMKEEKTATGGAGSGRQLSIGGPVQVRR